MTEVDPLATAIPNTWSIVVIGIQATTLLAVFAAFIVFRKTKDRDRLSRVLMSVLPLGAVGIIASLMYGVIRHYGNWWSANRLAKLVGMAAGYELYPLPGTGRIDCNMYGPLAELVYAPTLIVGTPVGMLGVGMAVSMLLFFVPGVLVIWQASKGRIPIVSTVAAIAVFLLYTAHNGPLSYVAYLIHADAPAVGLILLAVYFLSRANESNRVKYSAVSGVLAGLAPFAKQNVVFAGFGLLLYAAVAMDRRHVTAFLIGFASAVLAGVKLIASAFSFDGFVYNAIVRPGSHGFVGSLATTLRTTPFIRFVPFILPLLFVFLLWPGRTWRERLRNGNADAQLVTVFVFMTPISIAGHAKIGGDVNAFALGVAALVLFGVLTILRASVFEADTYDSRVVRKYGRVIRNGAVLTLVLFVVYLTGYFVHRIQSPSTGKIVSGLRLTPERVAYSYMLENDESAYLPVNRLSQVIVSGKLYHSAYDVWETEQTAGPIDVARFFAGAPESPDVIVIQKRAATWRETPTILRFYPDYVVSNDTTGDAYWIEYRPRAVVDSMRVE
jgi:hypothetical protein